MADQPYIHGTIPEEQTRLLEQASFLSPLVFRDVDFANCKNLLELGCGVGAQTRILLQRWPHLAVTCVDVSPEQLSAAQKNLEPFASQNQINFVKSDGSKLPFDPSSFDSLFLCWILEHVPNPLEFLVSARLVLQPNAWVVATEVLNSSLVVEPMGPQFRKIWNGLNELQLSMGGNPNMGLKLAHLFQKSGYRAHKVRPITLSGTQAHPYALRRLVHYWTNLLCSALPALVTHGLANKNDEPLFRTEMDQFLQNADSFFLYTTVQWEGVSL